jgi:hypothetical protein
VKILIIPEDPTLDQYILKPIVERICADHGLRARVDVLRDPHLRGVDQALAKDVVAGIIRDNPMEDLFILMVDRDCDRLGNCPRTAARLEEHPGRLLACLAWQEVEVWMLALHRKQLSVPWATVRDECDPKETYADPFIAAQGWSTEVGRGRKKAMRELGAGWQGLLHVCPELPALRDQLGAWALARAR